jgi:prepilin-type N-terminal cleavage/methylation domain-containing protein
MTIRFSESRGGFTLIEMVITLCVFLLLAAAVFGIFSATLESASTLQDNQARNDRTEALGAWLKRSLLDLPASGAIASYHRDGSPFHVSGLVWGAGQDLQALDLQLQPNGEYTLRLAAYRPQPSANQLTGQTALTSLLPQFVSQVQQDNPTLSWRTLVRDLKSADWRFLAFNTSQWQDFLTPSQQKPAIVELTFQPGGTTSLITDDFWIPPTLPASNLAIPIAPPAVSANP